MAERLIFWEAQPEWLKFSVDIYGSNRSEKRAAWYLWMSFAFFDRYKSVWREVSRRSRVTDYSAEKAVLIYREVGRMKKKGLVKLKISTKLVGSFLVVLLLTAFIGVVGIMQADQINGNATEISDNWMRKTRIVGELNGYNADYRIYIVQYAFSAYRGDVNSTAGYKTQIDKSVQDFEAKISEIEGLVTTEDGKKVFADINSTWKEMLETDARLMELVTAGRNAEALALLEGESRARYDAGNKVLDDFAVLNRQETDALVSSNKSAYDAGRNTSIITIFIALAVGLLLAVFMARSISKPVTQMARVALKLADGDLTVEELRVKSRDEIRDLAESFNKMVRNLRELIQGINTTSESVAATSEELSSNGEEATKATQQVAKAIGQIAMGAGEQSRSVTDTVKVVEQVSQAIEQIASGAQEQSRSVVNTTSMVNEMTDKIEQMARGMDKVKSSSKQNGEVASAGGHAVEKTVKGMLGVKGAVFETAQRINELGEQSQKIGEIIEVIDDIAEQTNLLALNAAIEAARAGEHGKGFAVVADEVRKLAERSGKATKEIAQLITSIQQGTKVAVESMQVGTREVEEGVTLAEEAGSSLKEIVDGVETADEQVNRIMSLIKEILSSSREVSEVVNNVAAITEENTAATEQMAASAEQVNSAMQSIASVSEESAAASEEVSASTEELNASVEEISSSSEQLAKMAQELQDMVAQFKV